MRSVGGQFLSHIEGEVTTLANCWKLTRRDGVMLGFCDHDRDLEIDALVYPGNSGFTPSAIDSNSSLGVDNLDVEGMLSSETITEADILAGRYDFAEIEIFLVNYRDLSQGKMMLRQGWLGEVAISRQRFTTEVRGLTQRLTQTMGQFYSASCRATLGDARCGVQLGDYGADGLVSAVISAFEFSDDDRLEAAGLYDGGVITFTSGANMGGTGEVRYHYLSGGAGVFRLAFAMAHPIQVGDAYHVTQGCDKSIETCHSRFDNVVNFRGEPSVPGLDRMLETAGTRSPG